MMRLKQAWPPAAALALLLLIWEGAVRIGHVPSWIIPSPAQVAGYMARNVPGLWAHSKSTLGIALAGFAAGTLLAVVLAVALHLIPAAKAGMYPLLVLSQNIPIIVLAPLLVVWLGFGLAPKIVVVVLVCFFPAAVALLSGLERTDRALYQYMQMIGASRWQTFAKVEWPYAMPYLFSGLKISATYCIMGAVVSEWLGAEKGIGLFLSLAQKNFRTDQAFAAIFIIVALSVALFGAVAAAGKLVVRWNPKGRD